jgi:hypothetical protein
VGSDNHTENSEYSPVTPPDSGDDESADSGDEGPAITREEYDLALATINQTEVFIYNLTAARNEGVHGMTGRDEDDHESWSPVSDAPLSRYNPPTSPVSVSRLKPRRLSNARQSPALRTLWRTRMKSRQSPHVAPDTTDDLVHWPLQL